MSAYSDWKYGLITDSEYSYFCRQEEAEDRYYHEHGHYPDEEGDYREPCEWDLFDDDELMEDAI